MLTAAVRVPVPAGENVTLMAQFAPAATLLPQLLLSPNSEALVPVRLILVMLSTALPVLLKVTDWDELVVPIFCAENVRLPDERLQQTGLGAGGPVVPPPPPHAIQRLAIRNVLAAIMKAGRQRRDDTATNSRERISNAIASLMRPAGKRKPGGVPSGIAKGARAGADVVIVRVLVAAETPLGATEAGEKVQVAPVGQTTRHRRD